MQLRTLNELIETDFRDDLTDPEFAAEYLRSVRVEANAAGEAGAYEVAVERVERAKHEVVEEGADEQSST